MNEPNSKLHDSHFLKDTENDINKEMIRRAKKLIAILNAYLTPISRSLNEFNEMHNDIWNDKIPVEIDRDLLIAYNMQIFNTDSTSSTEKITPTPDAPKTIEGIDLSTLKGTLVGGGPSAMASASASTYVDSRK